MQQGDRAADSLRKQFTFIVVPMSENVEAMRAMADKLDALMVSTNEQLIINQLLAKYNDNNQMPRLVLTSNEGLILSKDEISVLKDLKTTKEVEQHWEAYVLK